MASEDWVIYMLEGVAETAATTLRIVEGIRDQMERAKHKMRAELSRHYSQNLLNNLFRHLYTRIEYVQRDLHLKARQTAAKYLGALAEHGFVVKQRWQAQLLHQYRACPDVPRGVRRRVGWSRLRSCQLTTQTQSFRSAAAIVSSS